MTPVEVQTQARAAYNAVGDTFFNDTLLNTFMLQACRILARNAWLIENVYSTSTVASQQSYAFPSTSIKFKRVTLNGRKLKPITMREDDAITLSNQNLTSTGASVYYYTFGSTIYLRPAPDTVYTLQIFSYDLPSTITNTSTLEIPELFHADLVDYLLARMFGMDQNAEMMQIHMGMWEEHVMEAKRWKRLQKRGDAFATVQDESILPVTLLGES